MNLKFCGEMYFWGSGVGRERERGGVGKFWVMYGKGCNMEYSLMECFL